MTKRMYKRHFTRQTNGFSNKAEAHASPVASISGITIERRIDASRRMTQAIAAGVTGKLLEIGHILKLLEGKEAEPKARGSLRIRQAG
ncbi:MULTISPECIES: hypothetical protein [unclassified Mesorhizobium]|uniref:hypothetical protein n=1 Tax=unclassified Mesorhizobium TaxID=325217 RepID=UPI00112C9EDA|nr:MULTISPECIES: hypothetical protein [unclassified Mesorhizobium]MBZ9985286.1 hypothetical protein [Mesorhizobium sp. BR-1-1-8]TPL25850.1 hypothetical protein FJ947_29995 [Mesorhizobium sp. B2-4-8]TPL58077.1 hypothetical protein FJ949_29765 [Mesorhizobium sp. B2-4-1]TPM88578.1 hypothetical protein FJ966_30400 [Mesorhizobium sp. B2-1-5]